MQQDQQSREFEIPTFESRARFSWGEVRGETEK